MGKFEAMKSVTAEEAPERVRILRKTPLKAAVTEASALATSMEKNTGSGNSSRAWDNLTLIWRGDMVYTKHAVAEVSLTCFSKALV